jgi:peptidoglycan/LPS O-acetylase OafA/YrhL
VITCFDAIGMPRGFFMRPATFLTYIGLVFLLSYLVHRRFERPMQDLLRRKLRG